MSRHDRFREMLARRDELTRAEEARLQEHLQTCSECQDTADAYARQSMALRSLRQIEPPPALRAWVLTSVHQRPDQPPSPVVPLHRRPFFLAPLAAALVLLLAGLAYLGGSRQPARTAVGHSTPVHLSTPTPSVAPPRPHQSSTRPKPVGSPRHRSPESRPRPSGARARTRRVVKPPAPASRPQYVAPSVPVTAPQLPQQPVAAPVVVSQQIARPLPSQVTRVAAPTRSPRPSVAAPAPAVRQPAPSPTPAPSPSGIPAAQPVTGSPAHVAVPNPGGVGVDKAPPEALVYVPPPAPPPPPPPDASTPPSANSISVPATPGPTSEVQAGPNPVLVPVTPTTPIP